MAYPSDVANLVTVQLTRFVTLNRHQLAGQVANLDFWIAEVRHALDVIDGYGVRFVRLSMNQEHFQKTHGTNESRTGPDSIPHAYTQPVKRIPDRELQQARRHLTDAAFQFLSRCFREDLISEEQFAGVCEQLGLAGQG